MRLGPSLGRVYRMGAEGFTQGGIRDVQTGRRWAYAAAERSETGSQTTYAARGSCSGSPDCTRTQT